jgi:hypothetical protein
MICCFLNNPFLLNYPLHFALISGQSGYCCPLFGYFLPLARDSRTGACVLASGATVGAARQGRN